MSTTQKVNPLEEGKVYARYPVLLLMDAAPELSTGH